MKSDAAKWSFLEVPAPDYGRSSQATFRYHLGKIKNGLQQIEIEGAGKGAYKPLSKTVQKDQHCLAHAPEVQAACLDGGK